MEPHADRFSPLRRQVRPLAARVGIVVALLLGAPACTPRDATATEPGRTAPSAASGDSGAGTAPERPGSPSAAPADPPAPTSSGTRAAPPPPPGLRASIFAGGCFWCLEGPFEKLPGVDEALSGYTGGSETAPTYLEVASGRTSHVEAVLVIWDPAVTTWETLLETYWRQIDPTDAEGQFADRGAHYRPVIFHATDEERDAAIASRDALARSGRFTRPIRVEIRPAGTFWIAEDEHQNYYREQPSRYERYRRGSGRAGFLERAWAEP